MRWVGPERFEQKVFIDFFFGKRKVLLNCKYHYENESSVTNLIETTIC